jgi:hypothetical protein
MFIFKLLNDHQQPFNNEKITFVDHFTPDTYLL